MKTAIEEQRQNMLSFKEHLEKETILKFKYGKASNADSFNIKKLLSRNTSNHVKNNKKAFKVSQNPNFDASSGRNKSQGSRLSTGGGSRFQRENLEVRKALAVDPEKDNTYEFYINHLLDYETLLTQND